MRSIDDRGCLSLTPPHGISRDNAPNFEFHMAKEKYDTSHHRTAMGKPTPSKWDDAQRWLVNLSRGGEKSHSKTEPRNSNADDRRLIAPVSKEDNSSSDEESKLCPGSSCTAQYEFQTMELEYDKSLWRVNKPGNSALVVRSICLRDMGTDMTPIASQEPSRAATPSRAMTQPASQSPISSGSSSPLRGQNRVRAVDNCQVQIKYTKNGGDSGRRGFIRTWFGKEREAPTANLVPDNNSGQATKLNPLEMRAMAWDEAERAKYVARFKREEVKIQAWENHQKRQAEMEIKRVEVKAERLKLRSEERYIKKLASARRIAEEKHANAESELNEKTVQTSETADYIRRKGHVPSSCSFKLPSFCW